MHTAHSATALVISISLRSCLYVVIHRASAAEAVAAADDDDDAP